MTPATIPTPFSSELEASTPPARCRFSTGERWSLAIFGVILLTLRVITAFHSAVNSDEPQHLHVVWGWANGLLPYRDVFDNHAPLFHLLCAPLFKLIGETERIIAEMRLAMIPLFLAVLWAVFVMGERLFSRRTGAWAALLAGFFPAFFFPSGEFRTDNLWAALWVVSMAVLVTGPALTVRRSFVGGLVAGAAISVSLKTTLLVGALGLGGFIVLLCLLAANYRVDWPSLVAGLGAFLAGALLLPAAIVAFFWSQGALGPMAYCLIEHNQVPGMNTGRIFLVRHIFPITLPVLVWLAWWLIRTEERPGQGFRRALLILATSLYVTLLCSFWPLLTRQDFLPFLPIGFLVVTGFGVWLCDRVTGGPRSSFALLIVATIAELAFLCVLHKPWRDHASSNFHDLGRILRATKPGDYVMDPKAGAVFRRRPYYFVLETLTRGRITLGWVKDDIVQRLIDTRTCMASDERLTGPALAFVEQNYLPFCHKMRVAGQILATDASDGKAGFEVKIPARYSFTTPEGAATGTIDGAPYHGSIFLGAGKHEFAAAPAQPKVALCWAQATEIGFTPFAPNNQ